MWSDPEDIDTWMINNRCVGILFGWRLVNEFCHFNGLELICRAHQLVMEGFKYWFEKKNLITVWSAPNYVYRCGNKASILKLGKNLERTIEIFKESPESMLTPKSSQIMPYFL